MFGDSGDTTTTTRVAYSPQQKKLISAAMPNILGAAQNPPTLPNFGTVQPFNPTQLAGQNMAINTAMGPFAQFAGGAMDASKFLMGDALSPDTNPYLRGTAEAAVRPVTEALTTSWLPNIRMGAMEAGGLGGSRQANLENRAIGTATREASAATGKIYSDAFQSGMGNLVKSIALAPQTGSLSMFPSSVLDTVGGQQYGLSTAQAQEAYQRQLQEQLMPYLMSKDVMGTAMGLGAGTSTSTTQPSPGIGAMLGGAMGGAATAGGLAGIPGLAMLGGPWGIAGGAGLGALSALFA